jgi:glycosyltransferase involved in cell wall biosynthesis
VPAEDMSELYSEIDVLVATSTWPESFGLVSREALSLNKWVIATDLGAMSEDIINNKNGTIIRSGHGKDLLAALHWIRDNNEIVLRPEKDPRIPRTPSDQARELMNIYSELLLAKQL